LGKAKKQESTPDYEIGITREFMDEKGDFMG
jgi:hypothetical protein